MTLSVDISHKFTAFNLNVQFEAESGITALFGRSGSGKTTVVNAIAGLITPDAGRIAVNDRPLFETHTSTNIAPHKRGIGYVFQDARLFPHLNVRDNLRYALRYRRKQSPALREDHVIDLLGIGHLLERPTGALSGGEKQRVAIGRALLSSPDLLLMDEPLAALDAARKAEILPFLAGLRDEIDLPIVYVSHSIAEVARLASHVVILDQGDVVTHGTTEVVLSNPDLVQFVGLRSAGSVMPAQVVAHAQDGLTELAISGGTLFMPKVASPVGTRLRVRILAQDVMISLSKPIDISALNVLECKITAIKKGEGPGAILQLACGQDRLLARTTARSAAQLGLTVGMSCYAVLKTVSVDQGDIG